MATSKKIMLDDDQMFALMKFRRQIADVLQPHFDNNYLQRWLRARNWDTEAAEKMLRQSLQWRQQWEVDAIGTWDPPEPAKTYCPSGISGTDKDGCPVVVVPFAGLDAAGMLHSLPRQVCIKTVIQMIEKYSSAARQNGAEQVTVIFDMENFSLRQYAWRPAVEMVTTLLQMYEANYPEILKVCYIVNAPRVFAIAFNIARRFLAEYTLQKIHIYKADPEKWQKVVLETIDPDNLPQHFGGKLCDPDGNPRLITKINQGGKIPKSFYKNTGSEAAGSETHERQFTTTVIKKGEKITLDLIAVDPGSYLRWEFRTDAHDIRFGITMRGEDEKATPVIRYRRVASHKKEESGVISCQVPATYTVTFDNTYSYFKSKKLHYFVDIYVPLQGINIAHQSLGTETTTEQKKTNHGSSHHTSKTNIDSNGIQDNETNNVTEGVDNVKISNSNQSNSLLHNANHGSKPNGQNNVKNGDLLTTTNNVEVSPVH